MGHSPIGAGSVFAMLGFLVAQVGTGLLSDDEIAFSGPLTRFVSNATVSLTTNYHKNIGKWVLLALVLLHIAAIIYYLSRKHNLVGAMLHGDKELVVQAPALAGRHGVARGRGADPGYLRRRGLLGFDPGSAGVLTPSAHCGGPDAAADGAGKPR